MVFSATIARFSVTDVSDDALASLKDVPDKRLWDDPDNPGGKMNPPGIPPDDWNPPFPIPKGDDDGISLIQDPPIDSGVLQFAKQAEQPEAKVRILQLDDITKDSVVPKLIAVSWPEDISPASSSDPTPFLVYFHANVGQNAANYYVVPGVGKYPFGYDYIHYGLWTYLNYRWDTLSINGSYCMGLPYQIGATKNVVLVLPLHQVGKEAGIFLDAESLEGILLAIQDFLFTDAGKTSPAQLGRVALAGFSASNGLVGSFLGTAKNTMTGFYKDTLKEIYLFDPPGDARTWALNAALAWAKAGNREDKMIRLYNQWHSDDLGKLVGQDMPLTKGGNIVSSSNNLRTAAYLPAKAWDEPYKGFWKPYYEAQYPYDDDDDVEAAYKEYRKKNPIDWTNMHSWIPQNMLVDALRRSKF